MARITTETATLRDWDEAGRRLRELEPDEYNRIIAIARAFIRVHDEPELSELEWQAMSAALRGGKATA